VGTCQIKVGSMRDGRNSLLRVGAASHCMGHSDCLRH